jgi:hypothetical protein
MPCVFVGIIYLAIWNLKIYLSGGQDESQDRISHLYALYFSHCGQYSHEKQVDRSPNHKLYNSWTNIDVSMTLEQNGCK